MSDVQSFVEWLAQGVDRDGPVGDIASYLFEIGARGRKRMPAKVPDDFETLVALVKRKATKTAKPFVAAALDYAWGEFTGTRTSVRKVRVEPALRRVQKAVKTIHEKGETEDESVLDIVPIEGSPAYVDYKVGYTTNLGSYESARVSVGISLPCYPEEVDSAVAFARDYVDHEVAVQIGRYRGTPVVPDTRSSELLTESEEKEAEQQAKVLADDTDDVSEDDTEEQGDDQDVSWESNEVEGDLGF